MGELRFRLVVLVAIVQMCASLDREKRILPENEACNPFPESLTCEKGDWIDKDIADCSYYYYFPWTCSAGGSIFSWVVEPDKYGLCQPKPATVLRCGESGSNTRCVCSDYKVYPDECRCQYWTEETSGENEPAFCTGYYLGGTSTVHHYACCNNCNDYDADQTCTRHTYQGGSGRSYCDPCGKSTGNGQPEYYFNCVGCDTQDMCSEKCDETYVLGLVSYNNPGLCWKWLDCFKGCCKEASALSNSGTRPTRDVMEFCGDAVCQQSRENPTTCPQDCCYLINSTCSNDPATCTPSCCQTSTCCVLQADRGIVYFQ